MAVWASSLALDFEKRRRGISRSLRYDAISLAEAKHLLIVLQLYLEDQTDTLVASIQSLVASIRQDDVMPIVRSHIGAITDVVGNVISATEGVIEEAPHGSRLATTLERAVHQDIQKLENTRKQLMKASVDSQALDSARKGDGKVKMLTQGLPPLAFGIARDMKSLVANIEGVDLSGADDFS
jgi:hypothetical protein